MKKPVFLVFAIISVISASFSQQSTNLTLDAAIKLALEKNISVIQSLNNIESADSRTLAAYGSYMPTLSASGGWSRNQQDQQGGTRNVGGQNIFFPASFSVANNFSAGLSLNYLIFDGFNREAGLSAARSNVSSVENQSTRTRQSIAFQVQNSYMNILRNEQLVKVSEENLKRDNRQLERITESNKVGAVALADVYRQQSQVAADELNLITAQNNYDKAKADLVALIGLGIDVDYQFSDPSIPTTVIMTDDDVVKETLQQLSQKALTSRPDYYAAQDELHVAESGVTEARSGYFPTISASLRYNMSSDELQQISDNKNINWGVNIQWNIFDAFRTNQSLQGAIVQKRNAEESLRQSERSINVEIKKALLDYNAARKQVEVSQKGLVSATEDRKIAEERYNLGAGTLLDLLTANAGLVNAQANNINATYNFSIAKRNLEYVLGERTY